MSSGQLINMFQKIHLHYYDQFCNYFKNEWGELKPLHMHKRGSLKKFNWNSNIFGFPLPPCTCHGRLSGKLSPSPAARIPVTSLLLYTFAVKCFKRPSTVSFVSTKGSELFILNDEVTNQGEAAPSLSFVSLKDEMGGQQGSTDRWLLWDSRQNGHVTLMTKLLNFHSIFSNAKRQPQCRHCSRAT